MKSEKLEKKQELQAQYEIDSVLFEQLAIKKLKELIYGNVHRKVPRKWVGHLLNIFRKPELVRQVGPGKKPLKEVEWKVVRWSDQIR